MQNRLDPRILETPTAGLNLSGATLADQLSERGTLLAFLRQLG